jgi:thiamine-phosphate pyrophosphorylase
MIDFKLYLVTDRRRTRNRPVEYVVEEACKAGVRAVQLREPDLTNEEYLALAQRIRDITSRYGARLFINDRIDAAVACKADGVHFRESSLATAERSSGLLTKSRMTRNLLTGVSVHGIDRGPLAELRGADFIVLGTIFDTKTDDKKGSGVGVIRELTETVSIPVFAIGGVTPERAPSCIDAGAHGVAVISAISEADNIADAVERFSRNLTSL